MSDEGPYYRLAPGVHAEVIGDRALAISFESGKYFTIRDAGVEVIRALTKGAISQKQAVDALGAVDGPVAWLSDLALEGIVSVHNESPVDIVDVGRSTSSQLSPIEMDDHLADLLKLDPIHEIGPEGWPAKR